MFMTMSIQEVNILATFKIKDLKAGMEGLTVIGTIENIGDEQMIQTRFGRVRLAKATIRDETGSITLNLWRDQIDMVNVGDTVKLEGAFVKEFKGRVELNLSSRDSKIRVLKRSE